MKRIVTSIAVLGLGINVCAKDHAFPEDLAQQIDYMKNLHAYERFEDLQSQISMLKDQVEQLGHQLKTALNAKSDDVSATESADQQMSEQSLYHKALALLKKKRYQESQKVFNSFLQKYPNTALAKNATYWLGEIHLLYSEYQQAKVMFNKVISQDPTHSKAADALFKLGMIERDLDHRDQAKVHFKRLLKDYPNASSAHLASQQLKRLN